MKGSIFRHPSPLPVGVSSGYVMTVLGPLPINEMGVTLMHEHILLDASGKWGCRPAAAAIAILPKCR